jgi:hypothetical protein
MKWTDRWIGRAQRKADQRTERYRQRQEAKHAGELPQGWVDKLVAHQQRVADQRIAHDHVQYLLWQEIVDQLRQGPVCGPDGVLVLICYEESGMHWVRGSSPEHQWPSASRNQFYALIGWWPSLLVHLLVFRGGYSIYASTVSGPPVTLVRRFPDRMQAAAHAVRLARNVRASGAEALRRDARLATAGQDGNHGVR